MAHAVTQDLQQLQISSFEEEGFTMSPAGTVALLT